MEKLDDRKDSSEKRGRILIFMNCHGQEIKQYLLPCPEIYNKYTIDHIITYDIIEENDKRKVWKLLAQFKTYNVIIMNNIKTASMLTCDNVKKHVTDKTTVIKVEFFRFAGFVAPDETVTFDPLTYVPKDIATLTYEEYYNKPIDRRLIQENFQVALEKLKILDNASDLKLYDFFYTKLQDY